MANQITVERRGGIGILGLTFVVLLVLRVAGATGASWGLVFSWWWLLLPFGIWAVWVVFWLILVAVIAAMK